MSKQAGVYKIINDLCGDIYIGSSKDIDNRWRQHKNQARKGQKFHLYHAMRSYGIENFRIEIIEEQNDQSLRLIREQHYIDIFQPYYNVFKKVGGVPAQPKVGWTSERKAEYSVRRKAEVAAGIRVPPLSPTTGNKDFRHTEESKQKMRTSVAKARARIIQERGSYITPEGAESRRVKLKANLTPERCRRYAEENEGQLILARAKQQQQADAFAVKYLSIIKNMLGHMTLCQIAAKLNADGHVSPRYGREWTDQTVRQILKRMDQPLKTRTQCLDVAEQTRKANADTFARKFFPIIDALIQQGRNMTEIADKLNADGHRSRRGADWTYQNVREIRKRGARIEPVSEPVSEPKHYIGWNRK